MRSPTIIRHFWKWFEQHAEEYRGFRDCKKKKLQYLLNELNVHLRAYCRHLEGFMGVNRTTGEGILIITTYGKARYFDKADKLVAAAPALKHWQIHSLDPPVPPYLFLDVYFPDVSIDTDRLWFSVLNDGGPDCPKDIIVYSELYGTGSDDKYEEAVRMVLYNLLGERVACLYIGEVQLANLSEARDMQEVMRLAELPAYIDAGRQYSNGAFEVSATGELQQRCI